MPGRTFAWASSSVGSICLLVTTQPPQIGRSTASSRYDGFIGDCPVSWSCWWYQMILSCVILRCRRKRFALTQTSCLLPFNPPSMALTAIDWAIVAAYFLLSTGIGFAFTKRGGESLSEYFLSGRDVTWWLAGVSMGPTTFLADTSVVLTGFVYN